MAEYYLLLKLVHIISSTLLFGTGLGTAFYMWRADRSQNLNTIAITSQNVVLADWLFTTPAVIIQPVTGIWMLMLVGLPLTTSWVMASLLLYVIIGLCWLPVVYIQIKVAKLAKTALSKNQPLPTRYRKLMTYWYSLGWPAFISVIIIFYFMVFKPTLW
ncbi:DUF2269 family protein [Spartinivicinus ruber]|uniref:DUF2269 family protein n=1 Tax=Spartinivicinus ruber TaxID=2683272 RepID=UPI0013D64C14|nr:DUF2269 domain-containing protein [Spartinivicinus ruber]